jgi:hypothetical protein
VTNAAPGCGHRYVPRSRRFAQIQIPPLSKKNTFSKSRRRFAKIYRSPLSGGRPN